MSPVSDTPRQLAPSSELAFSMIFSLFLSRFLISALVLPIFSFVRHLAFWHMCSVRFWSAACGFFWGGLLRLVRVFIPLASILLMNSWSFIMKGFSAHWPWLILGELRL